MKVPLFIRLLLYIFSRFGRLVLWEIIFILELQFAETQGFSRIIPGWIRKPSGAGNAGRFLVTVPF
jgi:hypothetical protein